MCCLAQAKNCLDILPAQPNAKDLFHSIYPEEITISKIQLLGAKISGSLILLNREIQFQEGVIVIQNRIKRTKQISSAEFDHLLIFLHQNKSSLDRNFFDSLNRLPLANSQKLTLREFFISAFLSQSVQTMGRYYRVIHYNDADPSVPYAAGRNYHDTDTIQAGGNAYPAHAVKLLLRSMGDIITQNEFDRIVANISYHQISFNKFIADNKKLKINEIQDLINELGLSLVLSI